MGSSESARHRSGSVADRPRPRVASTGRVAPDTQPPGGSLPRSPRRWTPPGAAGRRARPRDRPRRAAGAPARGPPRGPPGRAGWPRGSRCGGARPAGHSPRTSRSMRPGASPAAGPRARRATAAPPSESSPSGVRPGPRPSRRSAARGRSIARAGTRDASQASRARSWRGTAAQGATSGLQDGGSTGSQATANGGAGASATMALGMRGTRGPATVTTVPSSSRCTAPWPRPRTRSARGRRLQQPGDGGRDPRMTTSGCGPIPGRACARRSRAGPSSCSTATTWGSAPAASPGTAARSRPSSRCWSPTRSAPRSAFRAHVVHLRDERDGREYVVDTGLAGPGLPPSAFIVHPPDPQD